MDHRYVPLVLEMDTLTHLTVIIGISVSPIIRPCRYIVKIRERFFMPRLFLRKNKLYAMAMSSIFRTRRGLCGGALWRRDVIITPGWVSDS
jgi:hypothetical protein